MSEATLTEPTVTRTEVYREALTAMIRERVASGVFGVLLVGLRDVPVQEIATQLGGPGRVWVSLVGFPEEDAAPLLAWAHANGWDDASFGSDADATHAVGVRSDTAVPAGAIRVAIAHQRVELADVERLHSLTQRGYTRLGEDEVVQQFAALGAARARDVNRPQESLWRALGSPRLLPFLSLESVLDYFTAVYADPEADPLEMPRRELWRLGLLGDPQLLTGRFRSVAAIEKRLRSNIEKIEQIRQADPADRQKALQRVQREPELEAAYRALLRLGRGEEDAIGALTLPEAERLFSTAPPPPEPDPEQDDPETDGPAEPPIDVEPEPKQPKYENPAAAALDWVVRGEEEQLDELTDRIIEQFGRDEQQDISKIKLESADVGFELDPRVLALTRALVGRELFGGTLHIDEELERVLENPGPHLDRFEKFDTVRMGELRVYLERIRDLLLPDFVAVDLLGDYLQRRAVLTELVAADDAAGVTHADLLASGAAGFLYLIARPAVLEAADAAIRAYERLLAHLDARYHEIAQRSPEGALRVYGDILSLDLVVVRATDETAVLVSPLNPLALWKHVELARLVRDRGTGLDERDQELLRAEVSDVPEPLLALYLPASEAHEAGELVYAERIGGLPVYRPSMVDAADVEAASIEQAARKLAVLYPPAREDLRILLLNPHSLEPAARAVQRLLHKEDDFRHITLLAVREADSAAAPLRPPVRLDELHADGRVSLTLLPPMDQSALVRKLEARPAHLLAIAGEQQRHSTLVGKESTRLHPLSVPRRIEADPITDTLSLQPRSNRPPDDGVQHPYALYHDVVAALSQKPRTDRTAREQRRATVHEYAALLRNCLFCIVAGTPEERGTEGLLRLSQGAASGDTVLTYYDGRIVRGFTDLIREGNYVPAEQSVRELLRRIEEVGGEGVFSTISGSADRGFSESALQGQIGLAVALSWYREQAVGDRSVVISLDGHLARQWLGQRDDNRRTDLLGFRKAEDGTVHIDIIEVKSYTASRRDEVDSSEAAGQLRVVARLLDGILHQPGDLLHDRRRELLRLQLFREGLADAHTIDADWVHNLSAVLDGEHPAQLDLVLIEVDLDQNEPLRDETFASAATNGSDVDRLPIRRVRLSEPSIRRYLGGLLPQPDDTASNTEVMAGTDPGAAVDPDAPMTVSSPDSPMLDVAPSAEAADATDAAAGVVGAADSGVVAAPATPAATPDAPGGVVDLGFAPSAAELERIAAKAREIYRALSDLGIRVSGKVDADLADIGPSIVRYKIRLIPGERVASLQSRARDLMRELAVEREPIIDNLAGTSFVHLDLPRPERHTALLRPVLEDASRTGAPRRYSVPAGVTPDGAIEWLNITELPHMLVAGSTNSGKSVFLYSLILGLAQLHTPDELQLVLVDPKRTDFLFFGRLPHLHGRGLITDAEEAVAELRRLIDEEMEERTRLLEEAMFHNIHSYNARHPDAPIRPIVVVIDEFADLADVLGGGERRADFDLALRRLAQRARSVGIHLVIATQRPTVDVVNGTLKANLPCRVSFRLASGVDSRTILDEGGAEHLLGRGDMLLKRDGAIRRLQSLFIDEDGLRELVRGIIARDGRD
jgi:hypothetical protein